MRELDEEADRALEKIGISLEKGMTPTVHDGGIVMPGQATDILQSPGKENTNVRQETRRSSTRSWQRPTRRERAPSTATSVVRDILEEEYQSQRDEIETAYPDAHFIWKLDGFWLCTESRLITGFEGSATIISYVPFSNHPSRSWGFWHGGEWIGPRHTNFPDGSICSFEPSDKTWSAGDSIVGLLDLHTLWIVRQLHLRKFGTWPGAQCVRHPYERLMEIRADELCGCDSKDSKTYADCCMTDDHQGNRVRQATNFILTHNGGIRRPPASVRKLTHVFLDPPEPDSYGVIS